MATQEVARINGAPEVARVSDVARTDDVSQVQRLGGLLAASGYFADAREMAQAAVKVMAGRELGIPPIASMMGINIIKGKAALGAHLIASRIIAHGYKIRHKRLDNTGCELEFIGKDGEVLGVSSFDEADAKSASVFGEMYKRYPRNMYYSRAISNGCKWFTPEVTCGMPVYTPEELGANVDSEGNMVEAKPARKGSAAEAKAVAEEKIARMKAGESAAAVNSDIATRIEQEEPHLEPDLDVALEESIVQAQKSKNYEMLREFAEVKKAIGDEDYYAVLGANGYSHSNEIPNREIGARIYGEMRQIAKGKGIEIR